jgi:hypothetical protein
MHSFSTLIYITNTCTTFYFYIYIHISLHVQLLLQMQNPPKKGRDITLDIFILEMTCAFWRQNTFTNKPVRLAPKYFEHFIGSAPPLFILDPLLWIGSA